MQRYLQIVTMGMVCVFGVSTANADVLSVYGAAKLDTVHGTGDVFEQFSTNTATGVEAGIEVLGIDLWGEALWMDNNQAIYSGNFGVDFTFGDDFRVNIGGYTGPILFEMGDKGADPSGLTLSAETNAILAEASMAGIAVPSAAEIQTQYDAAFGSQLDALENYSFGWNLRGRLQLEYNVFPLGYIGVGGQFGYHYTISGEQASAGVKDEAINQLAESDELKDIPPELKTQLVTQLKQDVGAEEADTSDANGLNFNAGIYFKLEI